MTPFPIHPPPQPTGLCWVLLDAWRLHMPDFVPEQHLIQEYLENHATIQEERKFSSLLSSTKNYLKGR